MITSKDVYRCYSLNLMQFMADNDVKYILVAKDIKSNKVFYAFEKTEKFLRLLTNLITIIQLFIIVINTNILYSLLQPEMASL